MADTRTGQLRERVDIYQTLDSTTDFGGTVSQDILYWSTYASVKPLTSSKGLVANQEQLKDGYYITVRYRSDKSVNKQLKMIYRGKWLNLTSLISDDVLKDYVTFVGTYKETKGGAEDIIINTQNV